MGLEFPGIAGKFDRSIGGKKRPNFGLAPTQSTYEPYDTGSGGAYVEEDPYAGQRGYQGPTGVNAPTQAPVDWDMTGPGVGEQYWGNQQGRVMGPGQGYQTFAGQQDAYAKPGQGEDYWKNVKEGSKAPSHSEQLYGEDPGLGGYYDRAKERTTGSMNDQLAARGVFGTSAGVDQLGQAITDLDAQRANREADYTAGLAGQADTQRNARLGTYGNLAFGAQNAELARLGQQMEGALGADASELARFNTGMNAATTAQSLRRERGRDYMSDLFQPSQTLMGLNYGGLDQMLSGDKEALASILASELGLGQFTYGADQANKAEHRADIGMVMDIIGKFMGGGGGGMMGGGGGG